MTDKSVVPEGMVSWAGGDCAPADWDGSGYLMCRDGHLFRPAHKHGPRWTNEGSPFDIIAYTPKPNPLSLETSDLDPITPEEDALATAILAAVGRTRQSHDTVVRAIRDWLVKAGAVIVPVEPTEAMLANFNGLYSTRIDKGMAAEIWSAMLSAYSIQSGGEGGEG